MTHQTPVTCVMTSEGSRLTRRKWSCICCIKRRRRLFTVTLAIGENIELSFGSSSTCRWYEWTRFIRPDQVYRCSTDMKWNFPGYSPEGWWYLSLLLIFITCDRMRQEIRNGSWFVIVYSPLLVYWSAMGFSDAVYQHPWEGILRHSICRDSFAVRLVVWMVLAVHMYQH